MLGRLSFSKYENFRNQSGKSKCTAALGNCIEIKHDFTAAISNALTRNLLCEADSASLLPLGGSPLVPSSNEVQESRATSFAVSMAKQIINTKVNGLE